MRLGLKNELAPLFGAADEIAAGLVAEFLAHAFTASADDRCDFVGDLTGDFYLAQSVQDRGRQFGNTTTHWGLGEACISCQLLKVSRSHFGR